MSFPKLICSSILLLFTQDLIIEPPLEPTEDLSQLISSLLAHWVTSDSGPRVNRPISFDLVKEND
jgi:hypothetical protein